MINRLEPNTMYIYKSFRTVTIKTPKVLPSQNSDPYVDRIAVLNNDGEVDFYGGAYISALMENIVSKVVQHGK